MKRLLLTFLLLILLLQPGSAQTQGDINVFKLSDDHELEAFATAGLTWQEDQSEVIRINLTMSDYRLNNSEIVIQIIQILAIEENGQGEILGQNTSEQVLTVNNPSIEYVETVDPPNAADRFHLNISLFAYAIGGGVDAESKRYSFRFPRDSSIIVQRDNLVPVINLYGFPPATYFQFWLPIYGTFLVIMLTPALVFGVHTLRERKEQNTTEETQNDVEEETA